MSNIWSGSLWKGTAERVIASTAGGALSALGTDAFGILDVDARATLSLALGAGLASLLKALATGAANGTPSVASVEIPSERVVEKVKGNGQVVAGPANDQVTPGAIVRATSPPSAKHRSDTADRLDP